VEGRARAVAERRGAALYRRLSDLLCVRAS
jgi:hypothetical protein